LHDVLGVELGEFDNILLGPNLVYRDEDKVNGQREMNEGKEAQLRY